MIDKEAALELGEKILFLEQEILGLKAILMSTKQPNGLPIPWERMMEEDMPQLLSTPSYGRKRRRLQQGLGSSDGCTSLIHTLGLCIERPLPVPWKESSDPDFHL